MRSMEDRKEVAARFGVLVTRLAKAAGYETEPYAGGRSRLARDLGIDPSMVGRALDGKVLPAPHQFENWARVLGVEVRDLMVESGVISPQAWPEGIAPDVPSVTTPSQPLTIDAALDAWQIDNPILRRSLTASITDAMAVQTEERERAQRGPDGGTAARG